MLFSDSNNLYHKKMICLVIVFLTAFLLVVTFGGNGVSANSNPVNFWADILRLDEGYILVGITDLTLRINNYPGNIEPLEGNEDFKSKAYVEGRLAFYLMGKIQGKYLLTAMLDTGNGPLKDIFTSLTEKDSSTIFDQIDPDQYYPIYGDNSTIVNQIDTQGKLYVKLEWDDSEVLWGNYRTNLNSTELATYNRSLYGVYTKIQEKTDIAEQIFRGFWSETDYLHAHDEMLATGGILYYLKNGDLVIGSEKIKVEIRDAVSGKIKESIELVGELDYELDWLQGRLLLKNNIPALVDSDELISDGPVNGDKVYIVADYEYIPRSNSGEQAIYGLRYDLLPNNQKINIGNSLIRQAGSNSDAYLLFGIDTELNIYDNTVINAEWVTSKNIIIGKNFSDDGGISYTPILEDETEKSGNAYKIKLSSNLEKYGMLLSTQYNHWDQGFTSQTKSVVNDQDEFEITLSGAGLEDYFYKSRYIYQQEKSADTTSIIDLKVNRIYNSKLNLAGELRRKEVEANNGDYNHEILGALGFDYLFDDTKTFYGSGQFTLNKSEDMALNNRITLGAEVDLTEKLRTGIEGSLGNKGNSLKLGGDYNYNYGQLYSNISYNTDNSSGNTLSTIVGNRGRLNDKATLYTERKSDAGDKEASTSNVFGVNYDFTDKMSASLDYTRSNVEKSDDANFKRDILTPAVVYRDENIAYKGKVEYRVDSGKKELQQYILVSNLDWYYSEELSMLFKINHSMSKDDADVQAARFTEVTIGTAYRPITNDQLNLIGKYTYLDDFAPAGQEGVAAYSENSHIFSAEGIYDISQKWQLAEKVAYKRTGVMLDNKPENTAYSDTYLWINRLNYHTIYNMDIYGEYRLLNNIQANDKKWGFLFGTYKHINNNTKFGIGYNFTDFSDDLTKLDYNAKGWFMNLVNKW